MYSCIDYLSLFFVHAKTGVQPSAGFFKLEIRLFEVGFPKSRISNIVSSPNGKTDIKTRKLKKIRNNHVNALVTNVPSLEFSPTLLKTFRGFICKFKVKLP